MSKVSPFSSFRLEDFPSQREWIDKLFLPLNTILSQLTQTMTGQVTLGDNIPSFTKAFSGTNLAFPQTFQLPENFSPTQMIVAQAFRSGAAIAVIGAWSVSGDQATVSALYEVSESGNALVAAGPKYSLSLRFM